MKYEDFSKKNAKKTEGDKNLSSQRQSWHQNHLDDKTRKLLDKDARYFLHQSLSPPCLNVLESCQGSTLVDLRDGVHLAW